MLPAEAAQKLRISRGTMARLLHEGRIPHVVLSRPASKRLMVRIPEAALERYVLAANSASA